MMQKLKTTHKNCASVATREFGQAAGLATIDLHAS